MSQIAASPPGNIVAPSPPEGFVPRREFLREHRATANVFALMSISGSNLIRLYSFPVVVVKALRMMFENRELLSFVREDSTQNCCEFSMEGKPWTMPKNVYTEKLLLDLLTVLSSHGWNFLSSIDYGREHDDRLALTFYKPCAVQQFGRGSPVPPTPNISMSNLHDKTGGRRTFFGVSFASASVLRVISPPLNITPAILQAVRGAWPRGVVSEKKIGTNAFEFKLKGYKWFQEDTFATDSLRHILTLLTSLDVYDFSLITSLSLGNRSRVKDLWIFAGPPSSSGDEIIRESPPPSILDGSMPDLKRLVRLQDLSHSPLVNPPFQHRRFTSSPASSPAMPMAPSAHVRAATEGGITQPLDNQTDQSSDLDSLSILSPNRKSISRKPAPRAQVPVSALYDTEPQPPQREFFRTNLPSTISNGTPDMTGIGSRGGTPELYQPGTAWSDDTSSHGSPRAITTATESPPPSQGHSRPPRSKTPPALVSDGHSSHPSAPVTTHVIQPSDSTPRATQTISTGALLSPGVFRDSAVSSAETSFDAIPIKWVGSTIQPQGQMLSPAVQVDRVSSGPNFPGGWKPSPVEEKDEEEAVTPTHTFGQHNDPSPERVLQEVKSRVESPEYKLGDHRSRKSEAGVVGLIADPALPQSPPVPRLDKGKGKEISNHASSSSGQGWVLVNVDKDAHPQSPPPHRVPNSLHRTSESRSQTSLQYQSAPESPGSRGMSDFPRHSEQSPPPAPAQAIAALDAVEASSKSKYGEESSSAVRRLFSLTRRNSVSSLDPRIRQSRGNPSLLFRAKARVDGLKI
ncbi:hypothetical protein EYR40_004165 [Pleurotus pulmonarius]|nr:hypothetical protein EYR36_007263 [Pleurotus pulmonarius]KAF4605381.1 hypothetical protein EYR40_004165 [Pleurotus pulmonarius]KAF4606871.1 hypothetical protein EYR38_000926 [Pleurotus pulmonarius]